MLEYAPKAARTAAELGAHREAAMQLERAVRFADPAHPLARAQLLTALGKEHGLIDHWEDAASVQHEALALWRAIGDQLQVGHTLFMLAKTHWRLCKGDESAAAIEESVAVLEALPVSRELGWSYAFLCVQRFNTGADGWSMLLKSKEIAEQLDDMSLLATAYNTIGGVKAWQGEDGVPDLRRALEMALAAGDDEQVGRAYANLQETLARDYELAEAERVFDAAMEYLGEHDLGVYEHCLRGSQGLLLDRAGRWDEADALLVFDLAERALSPINKILKLQVIGLLDARRGRDGAERALDESLMYAESSGEATYVVETGIARVEAAWLAGDAEGIRREASRALVAAAEQDRWMRGALATWLRRCDLPDADLGVVGPPYELMLAGEWRAAADAWRGLGVPYEEALALLDSGDAVAMHEAVRIFGRLGATATVARAQAIMRQHGVTSIPRGSRADTKANRFGLTRREQEVLALICEGLTNAEIGAKLFIAEKTVDNHVSSVLSKMHVNSRRAAARMARAAEGLEVAAM